MAKLSDTQLIVLSKAAQREDGAATLPKTLGRAPAAKVATSLIKRKLMRQVRCKDGMPVWHTDDAGRSYSLVILRAGRDAIGVADLAEQSSETENAARAVAPQEDLSQEGSSKPLPVSQALLQLLARALRSRTSLPCSREAKARRSINLWLQHTGCPIRPGPVTGCARRDIC